MNRWLMVVGVMVAWQIQIVAECSIESQQEAKQIYQKALNTSSTSEQLNFLQKSLNRCYSPEIDLQLSLLKGDMAFDSKKYKTAKNHYNKMLTLVDQIKDSDSRKALHLLSYECLRDTYKAMGENELASIMQEKYNMRERQKDSSHVVNLVSSRDIVKELQLSNSEGSFRGVSVTQAVSLHVNYKFDSVSFSDDGKIQARELAIALKELQVDYPGTKVEIIGYTDTNGDAKYNFDLSNRRANSLKNYLVANFTFDQISFSFKGKGESEPICSEGHVVKNDNEYGCSGSEDKEESRRVEIIFGY